MTLVLSATLERSDLGPKRREGEGCTTALRSWTAVVDRRDVCGRPLPVVPCAKLVVALRAPPTGMLLRMLLRVPLCMLVGILLGMQLGMLYGIVPGAKPKATQASCSHRRTVQANRFPTL